MQVAQRGVAGPEIIDRETASDRANFLDQAVSALGVLHDRALSNLQMESRRMKRRTAERLLDRGDEIALRQLLAGDVHADTQGGARGFRSPSRGLPARFDENEFPDRNNQPRILGQGDELRRRDYSAFRMLPAHEGLEADDRAGLEIDDRLVDEPQLVAL